jgi:hypothetical protein
MDKVDGMQEIQGQQKQAKRQRTPRVSPDISEVLNMLSALEGQLTGADTKRTQGH